MYLLAFNKFANQPTILRSQSIRWQNNGNFTKNSVNLRSETISASMELENRNKCLLLYSLKLSQKHYDFGSALESIPILAFCIILPKTLEFSTKSSPTNLIQNPDTHNRHNGCRLDCNAETKEYHLNLNLNWYDFCLLTNSNSIFPARLTKIVLENVGVVYCYNIRK